MNETALLRFEIIEKRVQRNCFSNKMNLKLMKSSFFLVVPKLHALEKPVVTDEGTNIRLSCKTDVSTFDKIFWMHHNTIISQKSRYSFSENTSSDGMIYSLDIRNANVTDGGTYRCIGVTNGKRNTTDTIFLTVKGRDYLYLSMLDKFYYYFISYVMIFL